MAKKIDETKKEVASVKTKKDVAKNEPKKVLAKKYNKCLVFFVLYFFYFTGMISISGALPPLILFTSQSFFWETPKRFPTSQRVSLGAG